MASVIIDSDKITLPRDVAKKMRGMRVELVETEDGLLLKPVAKSVTKLRGVLKGSKFNTLRYMGLKQIEKNQEQ